MSIRLGNSCQNCEKYSDGFCLLHKVSVGASYTCDSFEMQAALKDDPNCVSCVRFGKEDCAHPHKAAPGMLCNHWAPVARA